MNADPRRRADLAGRAAAIAVGLGGLAVVVLPSLWTEEARRSLLDPIPERQVLTEVVTEGPEGVRTVQRSWSDESPLDLALAGGGALLLRIGIVAAAAFLAGAAAQRAYLAHFSLQLGPLTVPDLPDTAEAAKEMILELAARVQLQEEAVDAASRATERALLALDERTRSDVEALKADHLRIRNELSRMGRSTGRPRRGPSESSGRDGPPS